MFFAIERAERYIKDLKKCIYKEEMLIESFHYMEESPGEDYLNVDYLNGKYLDEEFLDREYLYSQKVPDYDDSSWDSISTGECWGGKDVYAWFTTIVEIPLRWDKENICLLFNLGKGVPGNFTGSESLLYLNGQIVQGLDRNHQLVPLKPELIINNKLLIAIKAFSGLDDKKQEVRKTALVLIDQETEKLYYQLISLVETIKVLNDNHYSYEKLLTIINDTINIVDFKKPGSIGFYRSITKATSYIENQLAELNKANDNTPGIFAIGHSHIDVAWLWRLKHTREKCARTFSSVLNLFHYYPDFKYLQSSPQLYEFIKEDYPEIFKKIKEHVKTGNWEVTGGMWVESDCNIPSGESLIRQILFGKRFIKKHFDLECEILWLPDVFGFSWALPQIMKKSNLKYFMTTKMSWSQFNRPEYDTFFWKGIDGSKVLAHYITTPYSPQMTELNHNNKYFYDYNSELNPGNITGLWRNYRQKDINDQLLFIFGYGDGGGGPTREMLELGKQMKKIPVLPEMNYEKAGTFFRVLEENVTKRTDTPVWEDELYLEFHRGTYTSQAAVKKNNRDSEILYHNIELFSSLADHLLDNYKYPQEKINKGWKVILRNQFHDILPGSSIKEVYQDSKEEFSFVINNGKKVLKQALAQIAGNVDIKGQKLIVFNSLPWERSGFVYIPVKSIEEIKDRVIINEDREELYTRIVGGEEKKLIVKTPLIPALGWRTFKIVNQASNKVMVNDNINNINNKNNEIKLSVSTRRIENRYFIIKLNEVAQIVSIYDREVGRQVLPRGCKGNVFQVFEDRPMNWDCWDIDIYYQEKMYIIDNLTEINVKEEGPERVILECKWRFQDSIIRQEIIVYADSRRVDFKTIVDWQEDQLLLKVAFPVDVRTTQASYEIQFGNIKRSTHNNTSRDYAQFEVPAQKWADLSERNYGASLLNNCKYGYDIKENIMRLTLIKSGTYPDPEADQGRHTFTYSFYPHTGDFYTGNTTKEAYELNYPLQGVLEEGRGGKLPAEMSFVSYNCENVILETVKKAEDNDSMILRFYEYAGQRSTVRVKIPFTIDRIYECNLMEDNIRQIYNNDIEFYFEIMPYEIKSFKLYL